LYHIWHIGASHFRQKSSLPRQCILPRVRVSPGRYYNRRHL
jgi:hypothetical protein